MGKVSELASSDPFQLSQKTFGDTKVQKIQRQLQELRDVRGLKRSHSAPCLRSNSEISLLDLAGVPRFTDGCILNVLDQRTGICYD